MEGSCAHPNESFGFIKGGKFFDELNNYQLLKDFTVSGGLCNTHVTYIMLNLMTMEKLCYIKELFQVHHG